MERKRGISITSAVLQFAYRDCVINLLDTPGHGDFSEDTYRVLAAVDAAVMLLDAAKGLEPQTLKLFDVCRARGIPVLTFVNKWDRPGPRGPRAARRGRADDRAAADADHLAGRDRRRAARAGRVRRRASSPGSPAPRAARPGPTAEVVPTRRSPRPSRSSGRRAQDELALLRRDRRRVRREGLPAPAAATPVLFGAALTGIGVARLLDALVELAPPPEARDDADGDPARPRAPMSGLVFKVQAGDGPQRTATGWRSCGSARAASSAAWCSPTPPPGARSPPSTPRRCSASSAPPSRRRSPATSSGWSTRARCARATPSTPPTRCTFPAIPSFAPEHFAVVRGGRRRHVQAVPQGHRAARQRGRDPGAGLGPARRPGPGAGRGRAAAVRGGHSTGWRTSSARRSRWSRLGYSVARRTDAGRRRRCWPGRARSRCCAGAPTARCSRCSAQVAAGDRAPQAPRRHPRPAAGRQHRALIGLDTRTSPTSCPGHRGGNPCDEARTCVTAAEPP